ncbi:hypothetical protein [Myxosarcina sp. GI1(2024)]
MNLAKKNSPKKISAPSDRSRESLDSTTQVNLESENRERKQPIPPPSHPRQYRAIGLIKGKYQQGEQMTQGVIVTSEGTKIEAVVLGRVISLLKNHLDLETDHVWVVYPRTKAEEERLHVQIVGVWEPETLDKTSDSDHQTSQDADDGYFSIRGEVIFFSNEEKVTVVKIKQFPRKEGDKPKFFKLKLKGVLGDKPLKRFWDIKVHLEGETLVIDEGTDLGFAQKRKPNKYKKNRKQIPNKPFKPRKPNTAATSRPILQKKPKS